MIQLIFKYDLTSKTLSTENSERLQVGDNELGFVFASEKEVSLIKDFKFGYAIYENRECVLNTEFPPPGVKYELADQNPISIIPFKIKPVTSYSITGWAESSEIPRIEKNINLENMYPEKPFPSWTWNGEEWEAPVKKKFDRPYRWNEERLVWEDDPDTMPTVFPGYEVE